MNELVARYGRWPWLMTPLFFAAMIYLIATFTELAEMAVYLFSFGALFFWVFFRAPILCLMFLILWLPLQTFVLSAMAATDIFSGRLITVLSSLKELALAVLLLVLLLKQQIMKRPLCLVDYLFLLNSAVVMLYALLPDSFFGEQSSLNIKLFGFRSALIPLALFLAGRSVPFDVNQSRRAIRLLCLVSVVTVLFGFFEVFFIPRATLIAGLVPFNVLKGGDLQNLLKTDLSYIVDYGGFSIKRMMSFFLSPLGLAYFLIFPVSLALAVLRSRGALSLRISSYPVALFAILCLGVLFSSTRAVIAVVLLLILLSYFGRHFYKLFPVIAIVLLLVVLTPLREVVTKTISLEDPSARAHAFAYAIGLQSVLERPLGSGLGQAGPTAFLIKGSKGLYGGEEASIGESLYLTMAVERGVPSVLLFIIFVGALALTGRSLAVHASNGFSSVLGNAVFLSTIAFLIASIPTEHWSGFQSAGLYWWFAGLTVQLYQQGKSVLHQ